MKDTKHQVMAWYAAGNVGSRLDCMRALGKSQAGKHIAPMFVALCDSGEIEHFSDAVGVNMTSIPIYRKAIKPPVWDVPLVPSGLGLVGSGKASRTELEIAWYAVRESETPRRCAASLSTTNERV